jgi:O-glycosyl hydrolase
MGFEIYFFQFFKMLFIFSLLFSSVLTQTYTARVFRSQEANRELFADLGTLTPGESKVGDTVVTVNPSKQFQQIIGLSFKKNHFVDINFCLYKKNIYFFLIGFGSALTETSAYNWAQLNEQKQKEIIKLLFDAKEGLDYTVCRMHINSPDFSLVEYTYVTDDDPELKTFDLREDRKYVLPFVKAAVAFLYFFFLYYYLFFFFFFFLIT